MGWLWCFTMLGGGLAALSACTLAALVVYQQQLIYVPVLPGQRTSERWQYEELPDERKYDLEYEDAWLIADDGVRLHSWVCWDSRFARSGGPAVLILQENAGSIALRLPFAALIARKLGARAVMLLSYRGYGKSQGEPDEAGLKRDARAALDHLRSRDGIDPDNIVMFGRSLGGAVAAHVAVREEGAIRALILENTFTSILDMVGRVFPPLVLAIGTKGVKPLNSLVKDQWRTIDIISAIQVPVLFVSGKADTLVPPSHMRELYSKAPADRRAFLELKTGGHMDCFEAESSRYFSGLQDFLISAGAYKGGAT